MINRSGLIIFLTIIYYLFAILFQLSIPQKKKLIQIMKMMVNQTVQLHKPYLVYLFFRGKQLITGKNLARRFQFAYLKTSKYNYKSLMKTLVLLTILLISSTYCLQNQIPAVGNRTSDNIYSFVDNGLRAKYWYYLTKAELLYVAAIQIGDIYQFLSIYRNIVGTFLAINTWKNQSSEFQVNTLVRLGNGYGQNSGANYRPVDLQLAHYSFKLGPNEYIIDVSDSGNVAVDGKVLSSNLQDNIASQQSISQSELVALCQSFSTFATQKFWYYLDKAKVVYSAVGSTAERNYCFVNYVNIAGTFFVIGNTDATTKTNVVDTFVRLGNGYEQGSGANYQAVNFQKITLPLKSF